MRPKVTIHKVPVLDTGIGREAGFESDAALIEQAKRDRAALESLVTPETLARLDAAEAEAERRLLFGDGRAV